MILETWASQPTRCCSNAAGVPEVVHPGCEHPPERAKGTMIPQVLTEVVLPAPARGVGAWEQEEVAQQAMLLCHGGIGAMLDLAARVDSKARNHPTGTLENGVSACGSRKGRLGTYSGLMGEGVPERAKPSAVELTRHSGAKESAGSLDQ